MSLNSLFQDMLVSEQLDWKLELNDNFNEDSEPIFSECALNKTF